MRNIGPTVEILMRRIRQEGGLALSPNLATKTYSRCEQLTNAALKRVLVLSASLATPKHKLLYNIQDEFADAIEITAVRQSNRALFHVPNIADFAAYDSQWFRNITGTRFESWATVGRNILMLYPGQAAISSVVVDYVKLLPLHTNFINAYNTASELPDEDVDVALALAEIILLARFRMLKHAPERAKALLKHFALRGFTK